MTGNTTTLLVEELAANRTAADVFDRLAHLPHCLFLDSASFDSSLGRYSFVAADPFQYVEIPADQPEALMQVRRLLAPFHAETTPGLPPFQGGAAGVLAYDLSRSIERIGRPAYSEFQFPALALGVYDVVVAWDHGTGRSWLISTGHPEHGANARRRRAEQRLREFWHMIHSARPCQVKVVGSGPAERASELGALAIPDLGPTFPVSDKDALYSNFTAEGYRQAVQRVIDYVLAGDVFQANLAQRLICPARSSSLHLYRHLRRTNPAPFAGYFDLGSFQVISASPERFLCVREGQVESRPIKGTRPRSALPEVDFFAREELLQSEKDRAENVMIVDLLRNDLSQACQDDSVRVTQLCQVELCTYVQHLVSAVVGRLAPGATPVDLVQAAFPGGSVTGAPKVRAMQIIAELEPHARGAYCGCLGYIGFDGTADWNILIRTITAGRGWWQFPVGGGIVAQSHPRQELEETWHKAEGLLRAIGEAVKDG